MFFKANLNNLKKIRTMCLLRTCCCGCTLRQGTIGIIIVDGISTLLTLLFNIQIESFIDNGWDFGDTIRIIIWTAFAMYLGRFLFGLASALSGFSKRLRLIHFIAHLAFDSLSVAIIIALATYVFTISGIFDIAIDGLFFYFDCILYSFYKEDEIMISD